MLTRSKFKFRTLYVNGRAHATLWESESYYVRRPLSSTAGTNPLIFAGTSTMKLFTVVAQHDLIVRLIEL
jgi:hypothetical protein